MHPAATQPPSRNSAGKLHWAPQGCPAARWEREAPKKLGVGLGPARDAWTEDAFLRWLPWSAAFRRLGEGTGRVSPAPLESQRFPKARPPGLGPQNCDSQKQF